MASGRALYQRYLQVIARWPLDPSKEGRDLATRIRARAQVLFPQGELTTIDGEQAQQLSKEIAALERITSNANQKLVGNSMSEHSTATGLSIEALHRATSTQFLNDLNNHYESGWMNRIKRRLFN